MTEQHSYLLEFHTIGNSVKVCAIDTRTGLEVSIVGPANQGQELLSKTAIRKLEYMLQKRGLVSSTDEPGKKRGRGLVV